MDVSPKQLVSVATALIPFLENDDANRALMGANMQRQGVPLVRSKPLVGTGMEHKVALDSGAVVICRPGGGGRVVRVTSSEIVIQRDDGEDKQNYRINGRTSEIFPETDFTVVEGCDTYTLQKFRRSNQGTCINQQPIVAKGDRVEEGEVIADGPCTHLGEIALGRNILAAFLPQKDITTRMLFYSVRRWLRGCFYSIH